MTEHDASVVELGLDTFGDVTVDATGTRVSDAQTVRNVVAQAVRADEVGVDFFGVGSTTARSSRSRAPRWCWQPSPHGRSGSRSERR